MTARIAVLDPGAADDQALVAELVDVINRAYARSEHDLWRPGWTRVTPARVAEAIRGGAMLTAALDGRVVGCACGRPLAAATADLGLLAVAPERWGDGVGREIVGAAEDELRSRGFTTIRLALLVPRGRAHAQKDRVRAWYLRLGYRVVRAAPFDEIASHEASELATPCEFLVFHKHVG